MHHPPLVSMLERLAHLDAYLADIGVAERALPKVVAKRVPLDVLGDEQGLIGLFVDLVDGEDVVMAELGGGLGLPHHPPVDVGGPADHLDGDRPPHLLVVGEIHGGERPAAELADDPVPIVEKGGLNHGGQYIADPEAAERSDGERSEAKPSEAMAKASESRGAERSDGASTEAERSDGPNLKRGEPKIQRPAAAHRHPRRLLQ